MNLEESQYRKPNLEDLHPNFEYYDLLEGERVLVKFTNCQDFRPHLDYFYLEYGAEPVYAIPNHWLIKK